MIKYTERQLRYLEKASLNYADFKELYSELRACELPLSLAGRLEELYNNCSECQRFAVQLEVIIACSKNIFGGEKKMPDAMRKRLHAKLNAALGTNLPV